MAALIVLPILASASQPAWGQATVSMIRGTVLDEGGNPLKGVRVAASSSSQIGGAKTTYTDEEGAFRIANLNPGIFEVTATAAGLETVKQTGIELSVNAPQELTFLMPVKSGTEEVKIMSEPPAIVSTAANVKETFTAEFIETSTLPNPTYQDIADQAVGWNKTQREQRVRGGNVYDNNYTIDGFSVVDPVTRSGRQLINYDAVAAVEVQGAAYGAENANAQGGVLNVSTRTGSNEFHLYLSGNYTDDHMTFLKESFDVGRTNRVAYLNLGVGGPIVKDKLWYFAAAEINPQSSNLGTDTAGLISGSRPSRTMLAMRYFSKLSWQASARNRFTFLGFYTPEITDNAVQNFRTFPDAERRDDFYSLFTGLSWHAAITDNLLWVTQVGFNQVMDNKRPESCVSNPGGCLGIPSVSESNPALGGTLSLDNWQSQEISIGRSYQINTSLEWFKDRLLGRHDFKLGMRATHSENPYMIRFAGDRRIFQTTPIGAGMPTPDRQRDYCANDTRDGSACVKDFTETTNSGETAIFFLQDAWKPIPRLTISPGVALNYGNQRNEDGISVINVLAPTPHVSAVVDVTGDGKTALRGGFAGYVDTGTLQLARYASRAPFYNECRWNPATNAYDLNCTTGGGLSRNTVGQPCGSLADGSQAPGPNGAPCIQDQSVPRTWEFTVGGEREIIPGAALGVDFIYRRYVDQWEDAETNRIWNNGGTALREDGGYKNGRAEAILDLSARPENHRTYRGVTVFLRKYVGKFQALVAWTRHSQYGSPLGFNSDFLTNPSQNPYYYGYIATDQRNEAKFMGHYDVFPWLVLGTNIVYRNGNPYDRQYYNAVTGAYDSFRSPTGTDPRNINDANDDVPLRRGEVMNVFFQLRVKLRPLIHQDIDTWVDVFNVAGNREPSNFVENDGPTWGTITSRRSAPYFRVGFRYRY